MKARFLKILILSWAVLAGCSSKEITKLLEIRGPVLVDEIPEKNFESFEDARAEVISSKQDSGTFRIKFLGSELCKMQNLGLWLGKTYDADQIWLNGGFIGQTGQFSTDSIRLGIKHRAYKIPDGLAKCGINELELKLFRSTGGRLGPIESIGIGSFRDLEAQKYRMDAINLVQRDIGIFQLAIALILMFIFLTNTSKPKYLLAMGTILFCGLHLVTLSGWPHELIPSPSFVYRLNSALTLTFLFLFLCFRFSLSEFKKWHLGILSFYSMAIAISFINFSTGTEADFLQFYKFALLGLLVTIFTAQILLSSNGSRIEYCLCFVALFGFSHDIERIWGLSKMGNISPYTSSFFILGLAFHFSHGLIPFFKEALRAKEIELLSKQNAAIARTTQSLAHDVRKPFSMLKMVLDAISSAEDPNESKEIAKASLPEVNQAMASVEGMIQDVMQIGSNSQPNQEVASPEAVIDAAVNEVFRIFPEADVAVEYDLNHRHCLYIDTQRVGRVFSNILVNALQAMNGKGLLWIKTKEDHQFIEFRLGNIGSCIQKESLSKLFEAFFTSGKKGGTGLGLAIAQKVVNEHGGRIRCHSNKNEKYPTGFVEFIFTLPISDAPNLKRADDLPKHSSVIHAQLLKLKKGEANFANTDDLELESVLIKRLKAFKENIPPILIVDEEAVYRNSLGSLLTNFRGGESAVSKIPLVFARNAVEALHLAKEHNPFLVIQDVDLGIGSKNGIDVIKELRKAGYRGRVTVHSNRFLFDDQKIATEAGADSVLPKPMSRAHLFKLIASALADAPQMEAENSSKTVKTRTRPRIAYIDDSITFTLSWKMKLKEQIDVETFSSTNQFFTKIQSDPGFLQSLDVIVTDYYFGPEDPLNGKSFAAELRQMGYEKPIYLASNGDFVEDDFKPILTGTIGKDLPDLQTVLSWMDQV